MIEAPAFHNYLAMAPDARTQALASVIHDICVLIGEVALAEAKELECRIDGWQHSRDNSLKAQEMAGTIASAAAKQTLIDRRSDLAIKTEEKWFLLRLLDGSDLRGPSR